MRVSDIAEAEKTSTTSVYRAIRRLGKRLEGHSQEDRGVTTFDIEGVAMIRDSIRAASVRPVPVSTVPAMASPEIGGRLDEIEKGMLALVDEVRGLRKENAALREKVASLDPAEGFRRFYSSFFSPAPRVLETCRDRYYHEPLMLTGPDNIVQLFASQGESS